MPRALALIVFLLLVAAAAGVGSRFTPGAWYAGLHKPWFTPPDLVFPIAWTLLYLAMAVAAWRVWIHAGVGIAMAWWIAQLLVNAAWSWIVFGRHQLGWGLLDIAVLLVLVAGCTLAFFARSRLAGALMLPYLGWVAFAFALNAALWYLNRGS